MIPESPEQFQPGLYEKLLSQFDQQQLDAIGDPRFYTLAEVDPEERHLAIAQFIERILASSLSLFRGKDTAERQRRLANRVIACLIDELGDQWAEKISLADPLQRLLAVHTSTENPDERPDTPLSRSTILTGTRLDPSLASQLKKEITSVDRVDILCSFIRWSGLRLILDSLNKLTAQPTIDGTPRLRVITTSYMGATDPKAVETLMALPHTQVRVSYDTKRTRLHAKAYLMHRRTGFGSAYVGSANLSHAALSEGLEWTPKISQYELPHLWEKIVGTFETYWNDDEFEPLTNATGSKFRDAIKRERSQGTDDQSTMIVNFNLHPYPYQEEILDIMSAEREVQNKHRHLIVAATGTGKTMIAAFDYKRWIGDSHPRPRLLFIAHREEILKQAMGTYRAVLRDQNFGDMLVGANQPAQMEHLFCSIQSYNSRDLRSLPPDHFDYVVVDEFHHAEAPSYQRLMNHIQPKILLGMTATPERSDGLDVFRWFGGEASAEIRLPDAISRRLLCPFQYFGVSDPIDLDGLTWQRGGYDVRQLDHLYTGNDIRAGLIVDKVHELLLDPLHARGLGFCVSVAHAQFMARFFTDHGIPSASLSAKSTNDERRSVQRRLVAREINFLFVVDLYNEGIDIPEIDTVLFLRPTESLTIYLQQLGRGLRLYEEKECLTIIDFIGAQHKRFRFASRLRALSTEPTTRLDREVEKGFLHLPPGCSMQMERVAQQRVLENIRQSLHLRRLQMVSEIRELGRHLGRAPTLQKSLDYLQTELDAMLKHGLWSRLLSDAGLAIAPTDADEETLARGIRRIAHIDDPHHIQFLLAWLNQPNVPVVGSMEERRLNMLLIVLFSRHSDTAPLENGINRLLKNPAACNDLSTIFRYRLSHAKIRTQLLDVERFGPLGLHGSYTRDEILAALGHSTMETRPPFREGCLHIAALQIDAFFVTLHKTEDAYSPTTMYEDYAISERLFHWQSQSTISDTSPTGQRYINHREMEYTPLLFVREHKRLSTGLSSPYCFLGPAEHVSHKGNRPISIIWHLDHAMPARLLRMAARQTTG